MQRRKSRRHVNAARARWRMAEQRAQAEREAGIEDRPLTDEHISALYVSGWGAYCSRSSFIAIFREAERVHRIGKQEG